MVIIYKVELKTRGMTALVRSDETLADATLRWLEASGQETAFLMKKIAPKRSGNLADSIGWLMQEPVVIIGPEAEYAEPVEVGSRPHIIKAKVGGTLAFEIGGNMVFAKSVQHPGFAGRYYAAQTAEEAPQILADLLSRMIEERYSEGELRQ